MNLNYRRYKEAWINARAPHLSEFISKDDAKKLLSKGGYFVRSISDFDCKVKTSFWFLIKDHFGSYEELSSKTRQKVRKSINSFDIIKVSKDELIEKGYDVYVSAMENYKVKSLILSKENYVKKIKSYGNEYEFWLCVHKETSEIAAYTINRIVDGICEYDIMRGAAKFLTGSQYPLYGLFFKMNEHYLEEIKCIYVSDGSRSISEHSNIQSFVQEKFNFRKAYCKFQIEYVWWLKIFVNLTFTLRNYIPLTEKIPFLMTFKSLLNQEAMRRGQI
jgi:hypothetical protein